MARPGRELAPSLHDVQAMKATHISSSTLALRLGAALVAVGLAGCASTVERFVDTPRQSMVKRVDDTAAQAAELNGRIDAALRALDDIANHPAPDLQRQFGTYRDAVNRLEDAHNSLRGKVEAMEAEGRDYLVAWDREIATIRDEDLRNRTGERRADVAENIDALHERWIAAREAVAPLVHRLREIETALRVDLTTAGVESIRPSVQNANDVENARGALRELSEAFRRANVALAAATTPGADRRSR